MRKEINEGQPLFWSHPPYFVTYLFLSLPSWGVERDRSLLDWFLAKEFLKLGWRLHEIMKRGGYRTWFANLIPNIPTLTSLTPQSSQTEYGDKKRRIQSWTCSKYFRESPDNMESPVKYGKNMLCVGICRYLGLKANILIFAFPLMPNTDVLLIFALCLCAAPLNKIGCPVYFLVVKSSLRIIKQSRQIVNFIVLCYP